MTLPNASRAFIDIRKLTSYCLDPEHPVGRHKAVVFRRALGLTVPHADTLRDLLLRAVLVEEAVLGPTDKFGRRYQVDFRVNTPAGSAVVRSAWMVRSDEDFARLATCFVLRA